MRNHSEAAEQKTGETYKMHKKELAFCILKIIFFILVYNIF